MNTIFETRRRWLLRSLRGFDLGGGDLVTFGPNDPVGRNFVELTMVGANGKFVR